MTVWVSPLGNTYSYRIEATTSRFIWWVSVIDTPVPRSADQGRLGSAARDWPRLPLAFGEYGGWHVCGTSQRARRNAERFIAKQLRKDQRQVGLRHG